MTDTAPLKQNEAAAPTTSTPVKSQGQNEVQKESAVQEHDFTEPTDQYELKFDFTGKLKNYASSRWKHWLKSGLIVSGIFLAIAILCIVAYEVGQSMRYSDVSQIPGEANLFLILLLLCIS